jgi:hypothetical protein
MSAAVIAAVGFVAAPANARDDKDKPISGAATSGAVTGETVTLGTATAPVEGRDVRVVAPGSVSVNVTGAKATVHIDKHLLEIEKERLVLNGQEQGTLPAGSKKIDVSVKDEMLTVTADGKEVLQAKLHHKP